MIYKTKREAMVRRLQGLGISDEHVLGAMAVVPRHKFVAAGSEFQAYDEKALPIGYEQTISHPYTVALMSQALSCSKGSKVLEIGTGSGYQAAVLCQMGIQVFSVERIVQLGRKAETILRDLGYHFAVRIGDGTLGWQSYGPYDGIVVTAGAPVSPEKLMHQLKQGGKMLIPLGSREEQILTMFIRDGESFKQFELQKLSFVPLIGQHGWKE